VKIIRAVLKRLGIDAFPLRKGYHYVPDYYGTAAPKMIDIRSLPEFSTLAQTVIEQKRTLLYYDRLYTIYQALKRVVQFSGIADSNMAEVGVYKGGGSYFIASTLAALGCDSIVLNCFDTFEGHVAQDVRSEDPLQRVSAFNDTSFDSVKSYLSQFPNIRMFKGRIQDTSRGLNAKKFSFVHLDIDLYEPTAHALEFFDKRLLPGCVVVVDDYGFLTCPGVKQAVDEFMKDNTRYFGLHLLTGQYILTKH
jgi:hypothetical protein